MVSQIQFFVKFLRREIAVIAKCHGTHRINTVWHFRPLSGDFMGNA